MAAYRAADTARQEGRRQGARRYVRGGERRDVRRIAGVGEIVGARLRWDFNALKAHPK